MRAITIEERTTVTCGHDFLAVIFHESATVNLVASKMTTDQCVFIGETVQRLIDEGLTE